MRQTRFPLLAFLFPVVAVAAPGVGHQVEVPPQGDYGKIDTSRIVRDMDILSRGRDADKDALVKKIKKSPGDYAPPVFMLMAQRLYENGDSAGAYFWFSFGRIRGRYDAARCADVSARQGIDLMVINVDPDLRMYPKKMKAEEFIPFARKVVQLDSDTPHHYDHRWLNLHGIGAFAGGKRKLSVPESEWPQLLEMIRKEYLKGAEEMARRQDSASGTNTSSERTSPVHHAA